MPTLQKETLPKRLTHLIGPVLGLAVFFAALIILRRELHAIHYHEVQQRWEELPQAYFWAAVFCSLLSYFLLTFYDALGFYYIRRPLAYGKIVLAGFISHAFSNNMGVWLLGGAPLRYRMYSEWGLTAVDAAKVTAFGSITFALGLFTVAGSVFVVEPLAIPQLLHLPFISIHPVGWAFLTVVAAYLVLVIVRTRPLTIREWKFDLPTFGMAVMQIVIASADWIVSGLVLWILMPDSLGVNFPAFMAIFLFGHIAGTLSQVPGGLGVFETVMVLFFSGNVPVPDLLATLVAYRAIYYLLPLTLATISLGIYEVALRRTGLARVLSFFGRWASGIVPQLLAFTTAVAGAILLFSGATPGIRSRLAFLDLFLPLPVIELSHFLGSIVGACLLFLAQGLRRRIDAAWAISVGLLIAGVILSLLKGGDFEEAIALTIMLAVLVPCRSEFKRKASLLHQTFSLGWILSIAMIISASVWLGIFSYQHKLGYAGDLWWRFALNGDAPRFLRATVGVTSVVIFFALARLFRTVPPKPKIAGPEEIELVKPLVKACPRTYASCALLGDKAFLFNEQKTGFIMYGVSGRTWVCVGDPVAEREEDAADLAWSFRELCDRYAGWPVFYDIESTHISTYLDLGLTLVKIGEEAHVPLANFHLEGNANKNLRHSHARGERDGCTFEMVLPEAVMSLMPELKIVSDAWLKDKATREKTFTIGYFDPTYLSNFPMAVVRHEGKIAGFANVWLGGKKFEMSVDLMRFLPGAPESTMDYLFIELMLWGQKAGYQEFDMGQAPLAGLVNRDFAPLWHRLAALAYHHGEQFFNFQGLHKYKDKFHPRWETRYIACPGGTALPRVLTSVLAINSGGLVSAFRK